MSSGILQTEWWVFFVDLIQYSPSFMTKIHKSMSSYWRYRRTHEAVDFCFSCGMVAGHLLRQTAPWPMLIMLTLRYSAPNSRWTKRNMFVHRKMLLGLCEYM